VIILVPVYTIGFLILGIGLFFSRILASSMAMEHYSAPGFQFKRNYIPASIPTTIDSRNT
jgi:hypothetical protein